MRLSGEAVQLVSFAIDIAVAALRSPLSQRQVEC